MLAAEGRRAVGAGLGRATCVSAAAASFRPSLRQSSLCGQDLGEVFCRREIGDEVWGEAVALLQPGGVVPGDDHFAVWGFCDQQA